MSIFEAIVLGAVQGITEFIPISSSGHLVIVPELFGWEHPGPRLRRSAPRRLAPGPARLLLRAICSTSGGGSSPETAGRGS